MIAILASPEGFEPSLAVLETVVLPLTLGRYIGAVPGFICITERTRTSAGIL